MPNQSITINFSPESEVTSSAYGHCPSVLEQAAYDGAYVTKIDLIKALEENLFNGPANVIDCSLNSAGEYTSVLQLFSGSHGISSVGVTNGVTGAGVTQSVEVTESVQFSLDTEQSLKYPVSNIKSFDWQGDVYDQNGTTVPEPSISVEGDVIVVSEKVFGTVIVVYMTIRETAVLTVYPRTDSAGTVYDSVAWAIKDCGVELLILDPPPTAEHDFANNINCWGGQGKLTIEGPDDREPTADAVDIDIKIDYCTQKVI